MRATEKQAAQEVGQWSEKVEQTLDTNVTFTIEFDRQGQHIHETGPRLLTEDVG
jgi:hypothetical protein